MLSCLHEHRFGSLNNASTHLACGQREVTAVTMTEGFRVFKVRTLKCTPRHAQNSPACRKQNAAPHSKLSFMTSVQQGGGTAESLCCRKEMGSEANDSEFSVSLPGHQRLLVTRATPLPQRIISKIKAHEKLSRSQMPLDFFFSFLAR